MFRYIDEKATLNQGRSPSMLTFWSYLLCIHLPPDDMYVYIYAYKHDDDNMTIYDNVMMILTLYRMMMLCVQQTLSIQCCPWFQGLAGKHGEGRGKDIKLFNCLLWSDYVDDDDDGDDNDDGVISWIIWVLKWVWLLFNYSYWTQRKGDLTVCIQNF